MPYWHPLIFLDVDGVLNAHEFDPEVLCGQIHPDKVCRLNRVLRETGARVVLSSAWRYIAFRDEATILGLEWLFRSHGMLAGRLAGLTWPDTMKRWTYNGYPASWPLPNERGAQITRWLAENPYHRPYVVLDDLDLGISDEGHPFVHVDGMFGLSDDDAGRAAEILKGGNPCPNPS
jgi:hypothetical protein